MSLLLDIAAAKLLVLPDLKEFENEREEVFSILEQQFNKLDNTRLGYRIDRKREALMILNYKMKIKASQKRLGLYFPFLKNKLFHPHLFVTALQLIYICLWLFEGFLIIYNTLMKGKQKYL